MNNAADLAPGLLLVVHGTRDPEGVAEARRTVAMVAQRVAPRPVEMGFIELAEPSIGEAVARLTDRGVRRLTVAPLMLFAANHVKQDIPRMVAAGLAGVGLGGAGLDGDGLRGADVQVSYADPLECHPAVLEVSAARFAEQIDLRDGADTLLLLVGRGSGDSETILQFEEFARQRQQLTPAAELRVCYLAVASPSFEDSITAACFGPQQRVVIQPHLLFQGRLMRQLQERIVRCRADRTTREWLLCQHLGPNGRVVDAVVERVAEAERRGAETGTA